MDDTFAALNGGVVDEAGDNFFFFFVVVEVDGRVLVRTSGEVDPTGGGLGLLDNDDDAGGKGALGSEGEDRFDPDGVGGLLPDFRENDGSGSRFSFSFFSFDFDDDGCSASDTSSFGRLPFFPPPSFEPLDSEPSGWDSTVEGEPAERPDALRLPLLLLRSVPLLAALVGSSFSRGKVELDGMGKSSGRGGGTLTEGKACEVEGDAVWSEEGDGGELRIGEQ